VSKSNPNRMSVSETLRMVLQRGTGHQDSVSLTRNAKGDTQIEVVARSREDESLDDVGVRARAEYDLLRTSYPYTNGPS
jgi:hypothetical protein